MDTNFTTATHISIQLELSGENVSGIWLWHFLYWVGGGVMWIIQSNLGCCDIKSCFEMFIPEYPWYILGHFISYVTV